jgi:hypothetical protein
MEANGTTPDEIEWPTAGDYRPSSVLAHGDEEPDPEPEPAL